VVLTRISERVRSIDERHGVGDILSLEEFRKKQMSENRCYCGFRLHVEQFVCLGSDSGIQPISLIIESDHSLVNRSVTRTLPSFGLQTGFVDPIVNG
jgi:hypothetical protein